MNADTHTCFHPASSHWTKLATFCFLLNLVEYATKKEGRKDGKKEGRKAGSNGRMRQWDFMERRRKRREACEEEEGIRSE